MSKRVVTRCISFATALAVLVIAGECTSRVDDYIHLGVPLSASPDHERDLMVAETWGRHGKPNGSFRKWKLNSLGFRGEEFSIDSVPEDGRVLILGSSETFGLREGPNQEYPAQLQRLLRERGDTEVLNAALPGMAVNSMFAFWENWASRVHPSVVVIYPSPIFYLRDEPPRPEVSEQGADLSPKTPIFQSRLGDRIVSAYRSLPLSVRNIRRQWLLKRQLDQHGPEWPFVGVPEDRLRQYRADVITLIEKVRDSNSAPILVTYAISAQSADREEDQLYLFDMRFDFPRAPVETLVAFQKAANQALREIAAELDVPLIDADQSISGHLEYFTDLVHFSNEGARRLAEVLADGLLRIAGTTAGPSTGPIEASN